MSAKGYFAPGGRRTVALPGVTVPAGYAVQWPHKSFDLLKRTGQVTGPAWHVVCNAHGQFLPGGVTSGPAGDKAGSAAGRKLWCTGCGAPAQDALPGI